MQFSKHRYGALLIFILGILITTFVFYFGVSKSDQSIVNGFTLFGTFLSLFGIGLAYIQIQSVHTTSELTKSAIDKSLLRINQILSVSELSKAVKIIQEIQVYLTQEKYEIALLRMKDLKIILIQIKHNENLKVYSENGNYIRDITGLGADITNLHDFIAGIKTKGINFSAMNKNLELLGTTLSELESDLKFNKHDS